MRVREEKVAEQNSDQYTANTVPENVRRSQEGGPVHQGLEPEVALQDGVAGTGRTVGRHSNGRG